MLASCPGARIIKEARPEYVVCPHCDTEVEVWSDEFRARCDGCGAWVFRAQSATCLDWCARAEECVGTSQLVAYRRAREQAAGTTDPA